MFSQTKSIQDEKASFFKENELRATQVDLHLYFHFKNDLLMYITKFMALKTIECELHLYE